jgi:hypothetical protein
MARMGHDSERAAIIYQHDPSWLKLVRTSVVGCGLRSRRGRGGPQAGLGQGAMVRGSPGLMTLTGTSGTRRWTASTKRVGSLSLLRKSLSPMVPPVKA